MEVARDALHDQLVNFESCAGGRGKKGVVCNQRSLWHGPVSQAAGPCRHDQEHRFGSATERFWRVDFAC